MEQLTLLIDLLTLALITLKLSKILRINWFWTLLPAMIGVYLRVFYFIIWCFIYYIGF